MAKTSAKKVQPDTSSPGHVAPAPKQTQQQAGAGETPVIVALLVTAKVDSFRRCGRTWTKEQTRVEADELSEADIEALFAEPMLDVVGVAE